MNGDLPAFIRTSWGPSRDEESLGLTKREYFAAMAMQGLLLARGVGTHDVLLATYAREYADALLAELEKPSVPR